MDIEKVLLFVGYAYIGCATLSTICGSVSRVLPAGAPKEWLDIASRVLAAISLDVQALRGKDS